MRTLSPLRKDHGRIVILDHVDEPILLVADQQLHQLVLHHAAPD